MMLQSGIVVLILAIIGASGLVRPMVRPRICRAPNANQHSLAMSAKTLQIVKERYSGRADLPSMMDASDDDCLLTEEMLATASLDMPEPPQLGDSVTGYVVEIDDSGAFIEIGGKMSGFLPLEEASLSPIRHVKVTNYTVCVHILIDIRVVTEKKIATHDWITGDTDCWPDRHR